MKRPTLRSGGLGVVALLLAEVAVFALLARARTGKWLVLSPSNLSDVLLGASFFGLLAVGQIPVIVSGGIDLSCGSILAVGNVLTALLISRGETTGFALPTACGVALGLSAAIACGLLNGALVAFARLPPFLATLGMLSAARGLAYLASGGQPVRALPSPFGRPDATRLDLGPFSLYLPALALLAAALLVAATLRTTRWGRHVYALGGSERAALFAGAPVRATKLAVYALSGACSGAAGILMLLQYGTGDSTAGTAYELDAIAACVIGGVSLSGGSGGVAGPIVGALLMAFLRNGLIMVDAPATWVQILIGAILVIAVALDRLRRAP